MKPTVSIIMPTLDRAYIIGRAIKSVLAQTYQNWELIVMDDGSTDETARVIKGFGDPRIKYHYQDHTGPCGARNHAIELATGQWIAYLDSDNELLPEYLAVMLEHFAHHPKATFGIPKGRYVLELVQDHQVISTVDKSSIFPEALSLKDIFHHNIIFEMNGFMHARNLIGPDIHFDPEMPGLEDWDLVMQMGEKHPDGFLYVPEVLYDYRQRYGADGRAASGSYSRRAFKLEAIWSKHHADKLMAGQTWFPALRDQWNELERKYQAGLIPPAYLYEFHDHWPRAHAHAER
jgi:glycosyltransferase involved in cell wall biosynthesis